ncbi:MAG: MaoC family dehydratase [Pararhodobacter sp.]|nr:MaoC family dehydratase [Pararhodobacter sp.]
MQPQPTQRNRLPSELAPAALDVNSTVIAHYARLTDDFNPIHVDPDFAATTPMGGIIAHGMLSMSLIWQALARSLGQAGRERIELKVRFTRPVRLGDTVTAGGRLLPDASPACYEVWVQNQAGDPVIVGTAQRIPGGAGEMAAK